MAARRRNRGRRRRRNAGMPVVLVNPRGRRRRRRRRSNPRRSNPRRRYRRRRNPASTSIGKAFIAFALSGLGGGLAYGLDWGVSHAKLSATWQTVLFGGVGLVTTLGVARWGDERVAAGIGGGTVFSLIGRMREAIALSKATTPSSAGATKTAGAEAGAVYGQPYLDAGAVMHMHGNPQRTGARAMGPGMTFGTSFKESGAVYQNPSGYVPGPVRWYGPRSWAYNVAPEAGVVRRYVSAHSASR